MSSQSILSETLDQDLRDDVELKREKFNQDKQKSIGEVLFGKKNGPKLNASQILSLLRKSLKAKCDEELVKWGKCNVLLTDKEMEFKKEEMARQADEVPMNSLKYNRILLARSNYKETRDLDLRD